MVNFEPNSIRLEASYGVERIVDKVLYPIMPGRCLNSDKEFIDPTEQPQRVNIALRNLIPYLKKTG